MEAKTVLLVVADATRRVELGDALRLEAHVVLVAESADEALAVAASIGRAPDLVVTDERLDAGAGRDLVALVARRRQGASVLVLAALGGLGGDLPVYFLERDADAAAVARVATRILAGV